MLPTQLGKHFWPNFSVVSGIRIDYLSPTIYVTDILLVLLLCSFVIRQCKILVLSKGKSQKIRVQLKNKKLLLLCLAFLVLIVNIIFAQRPILSLYGFTKILEFGFLAFYLAKTIRHRFQFLHISLLFSIDALFESILAIFQYLNQGSLNGIFYFLGERTFTGATPGIANASINGQLVLRPYATFPHPNVLAGYLLLTMVLVWSYLLKSDKHWIKTCGILSLLLSSIALLLTFSRITILLWILLIFIQLFRLLFTNLQKPKSRGILIAVVLIAVGSLSFLPLTREVFYRFAHTSLSEESVTERTELLTASFTIIRQHPIMGVGLNNFIPAIAPLQKPLPLNLYLQPVHDIFVLVAAETGFAGFCLFIGLLLATIFSIRKQELRIRRTFLVLLLLILVTGLFDHYWLTLQQGQLLFATVIGLSWAKMSA